MEPSRTSRRALITAFVTILSLSLSFGQTVSSSLVGILMDPAGAVVPGAPLTLTNQATGVQLKTESSSDGLFRFPNLPAGTYALTVHAAGFKAHTQQSIVVTSSETRDVGHIGLQIGNLNEQVTVTAEATPLQTASSERSNLVTGAQLANITLKGRDFFGMVSLLPGVVDTRNRDNTSNAGTLGGMNINGQGSSLLNYTIDGVSANDTGSNSDIHYNANVEAIAEIKVLTSNYQAEYGRKGGATISVVTRGGTQEYHGSAYWSHRHEQFNAVNFFNNRANVIPRKNPYRFNVPGYSIGGPIHFGSFNKNKDKLFFFWAQEFTRQRRDFSSQFRNMPTALERNGDFTQSFDTGGKLIPVYDPLAGTRVQFAGNVVPQTRQDPTGRAIVNFLPMPNYVDPDPNLRLQRNYVASASGQYPRRSDTLRIDVNPTSRLRLYYRLINEPENQVAPWDQWFTGSNYLLEFSQLWRPGRGQAVNGTYTFSPTLVNEVNYGQSYSHIYYHVLNPQNLQRSKLNNIPQLFKGANGISIPETSRVGDAPGWLAEELIPNISFGGTPTNAPSIGLSNTPYENWNQIYSLSEGLTKMTGKHTIKAGVYIEHTGKFATNQAGSANYRGTFNFGTSSTNPFDTNDTFSNALLGYFNTYTESNNRTGGHFWFWNVESYVQDNWRVTRKLTLDIGVRVPYVTAITDTNNSLAGFDPATYQRANAPRMYGPALNASGVRIGTDSVTGQTVPAALIGLFVPGTGNTANGMRVGGQGGYPSGMNTYQNPSITPRVGFAWDVFGNGKTAVRGGFGMFTDRPNTNETGEALQGNPPITYTPTLYYGNLQSFTTATGYLSPSSVTFLLGENHVPITMNYSFGIQQSIGFGAVMDVAYVGNVVRHNWWTRPINNIAMFAHFNPANIDPTTRTALPDNFYRPYAGWSGLSLREFNSNSNYNSLQVSVRRQFARHMMFGGSYTFSKALGYSSPGSYFSPRKWNYGLLGNDRPHVLTLNYLYEVPGLGRRVNNKFLGAVTDDWTISGITTFSSGSAFTPSFGTTTSVDTTGSSEGARITVTGDPYLAKDQRTFGRNFNTDAFALTPAGGFGNAGIGILRGPGINNFDITIGKKIPIGLGEKRRLEFRAEGYNAFNHTQFSGIDSGSRFDPAGRQTNANFGAYSSARNPRILSFTLRLNF